MSDDIPAEAAEETPTPKKKAARKRIDPPKEAEEPKVEDKAADTTEAEAKPAETPEKEVGEVPTENPSVRRVSSKKKTAAERAKGGDASDEPVATIAEPPSPEPQGKKRRRRRRRSGDGDDGGEDQESSRSNSRIKLDPEQVEKKAWKIFLSEVSEEGLALVSDQDAKEIGRRSFRLAEIFLEEASRRQ